METYLEGSTRGYRRSESLLLLLLELGTDPFRRRPDGCRSSFELAVLSRREAIFKFPNACLERIREVFETLTWDPTAVELALLWLAHARLFELRNRTGTTSILVECRRGDLQITSPSKVNLSLPMA